MDQAAWLLERSLVITYTCDGPGCMVAASGHLLLCTLVVDQAAWYYVQPGPSQVYIGPNY